MAEIDFGLFDVDNHIGIDAEDCFTRYIDPEFRDRAVHWDTDADGRKRFLVDGRTPGFFSGSSSVRPREPGKEDWVSKPGTLRERLKAMKQGGGMEGADDLLMPPLPGFKDRDARIALMDQQGIEANLLFPNSPPGVELFITDPRVLYANLRAFNRWVEEQWGYAYQGRIHVPALLSLRDLDMAVAELDRIIGAGGRVIHLRQGHAYGRSPADPYFDPFWARVDEAHLSVAFHQYEGGHTEALSPAWGENPDPAVFEKSAWQWFNTYGNVSIMATLTALLYGNLFGRFPNIKVASVENGCGWLPYMMSYVDKARGLGRNGPWIGGPLTERPTAIARRHIVVTPFPEDDVAAVVDAVGHEMLALGSDYPHPEGMAEPREFAKLLEHLPADQQRWILRDNGMSLVGR